MVVSSRHQRVGLRAAPATYLVLAVRRFDAAHATHWLGTDQHPHALNVGEETATHEFLIVTDDGSLCTTYCDDTATQPVRKTVGIGYDKVPIASLTNLPEGMDAYYECPHSGGSVLRNTSGAELAGLDISNEIAYNWRRLAILDVEESIGQGWRFDLVLDGIWLKR